MNRFDLIGNVTQDIELSKVGESNVARFSIAADRPFKNQEGKRDTDFIQVKAWNKLAEHIAKYVNKGSKLRVSGHIETSTSEKDNEKRFFTNLVVDEVEFLSSKKTEQTESK